MQDDMLKIERVGSYISRAFRRGMKQSLLSSYGLPVQVCVSDLAHVATLRRSIHSCEYPKKKA